MEEKYLGLQVLVNELAIKKGHVYTAHREIISGYEYGVVVVVLKVDLKTSEEIRVYSGSVGEVKGYLRGRFLSLLKNTSLDSSKDKSYTMYSDSYSYGKGSNWVLHASSRKDAKTIALSCESFITGDMLYRYYASGVLPLNDALMYTTIDDPSCKCLKKWLTILFCRW